MTRSTPMGTSEEPLWAVYDVAMLDLDGVVYIGPDPVPGAPEHLRAAAEAGMRLSYVTNNAARPPAEVADHLRELGAPAQDDDVVTSAQAAARLLAETCQEGDPIFVIGGTGLMEALAERGLRGVQSRDDDPVAVVSGYHPDLAWRTVIEGAILVRDGLPWFASNTDLTVPTPNGPGPGNGVLVKVVADFAQVTPTVAGKPEPPLFHETQERVGGKRPLVVGDRLDTDIEGGARAGFDTLLVMTGVTGLPELIRAEPAERPTFVSATLAGLGTPHTAPTAGDPGWALGGWTATVSDGKLAVTGDGEVDDWWRVVAVAAWEHLDDEGDPVDTEGLSVPDQGESSPER